MRVGEMEVKYLNYKKCSVDLPLSISTYFCYRYTVEVADFDFGQQSNFDYKTFTERLRDSFRNAFNFGRQQDDTDPLTPNTRYDSMT